jgi:SAM-dependent methyltransferase
VDCPACGSDKKTDEFVGRDPHTGDAFRVVRCEHCTLAYVSPRPDPEHLSSYYPSDYFGERHPNLKNQFMAVRVAKLGTLPANGRLLDIGCGRGDFILACRAIGWQVAGVEQGESPVMKLKEKLGVEVVTPERIADLPSASFDVITLWHVFEHMPDPGKTLDDARRLLKPGGRLLMEVPNFGSWQARIGKAWWYHLDVPRHLLHFERAPLERLLRGHGFEPVSWNTFSLEYDAFGLLQTILNRFCILPSYLFQILIGQPTARSWRDTVISFGLLVPAGMFASVLSLVAPLLGKGGILRVVAQKHP